MATRSAAAKLDWARLGSQLGLRGNTASALQAFKKRNDDARRRLQLLSEQSQTVDFEHYRSILSNQQVINEIEQAMKSYQIKKLDVSRTINAIEGFEAKAVQSAEQTKGLVEKELEQLQKTLDNIQTARPVDDLTVEDVMKAEPELEKKTERMVSNHKWMPKGYKETYGDLSVL